MQLLDTEDRDKDSEFVSNDDFPREHVKELEQDAGSQFGPWMMVYSHQDRGWGRGLGLAPRNSPSAQASNTWCSSLLDDHHVASHEGTR